MTPRIVGIDLGTTNTALAWADPRGPVRTYDILQLVAAGEAARHPALPSFLYLPPQRERDGGLVRLPWNAAPEIIAGLFARDEGALVPSRQVGSAKSWLSNRQVDRTAPFLPWGSDAEAKLSPVEAATHLLAHLRDAWDFDHAGEGSAGALGKQAIFLTVPASFDEEARELTVAAARAAGLEQITLVEEPLAALYAWIAAHRRTLPSLVDDGSSILVCDVGGGTTDFSMIQATAAGGEVRLARTAIGEHLLLGGDNLDLALAQLVEARLGEEARLSLTARQALRRKCSAAKEQLLSDPSLEQVPITILGSGRGVVGGGRTVDLTRDDVLGQLTEGFLPMTTLDAPPARDRRTGLRELGLPYETEPAITRHLAAFLVRAGRGAGQDGPLRPDAVLFNGGFFTPAIARERVLDVIESWFSQRPRLLENLHPESAVAVGAAFYGQLRQRPEASRRLIIRAGSGRAYYIGVEPGQGATRKAALCVLPRGSDEGTRVTLDRALTVVANRPAAFTLYSTTTRSDPVGAVIDVPDASGEEGDEDEIVQHAPLVTAIRYGKRSRQVPIPVAISATFTETGTLELWCESRTSDHRWRLAFNLRVLEQDSTGADFEPAPRSPVERPPSRAQTLEGAREASGGVAVTRGACGEVDLVADAPRDAGSIDDTPNEVVIDDAALDAAVALVRRQFDSGTDAPSDTLTSALESVLGHGKHAWPLPVIRTIGDVLLACEAARHLEAAREVRWLNLAGFCIRPGFGSPLDSWRVSELRKVYAAGLAFPKGVQNQVEWLVLWQRVGAGFTGGQQRELAQRVSGQLGLGQRKAARLGPQIERESWRLLASLERLTAVERTRLGNEMVEKVRREPRSASWLWALSRVGARTPLYGPLNTVVDPSTAAEWIARLLALRELSADIAATVAEIGARTDDQARDLSADAADAAAARLEAAGFAAEAARLRVVTPTRRSESARAFGESLPEGLRLG